VTGARLEHIALAQARQVPPYAPIAWQERGLMCRELQTVEHAQSAWLGNTPFKMGHPTATYAITARWANTAQIWAPILMPIVWTAKQAHTAMCLAPMIQVRAAHAGRATTLARSEHMTVACALHANRAPTAFTP